jgi:RNA-directed DNA polymerase
MEDGELHDNEEGTPQGGSISVLLSNIYLHYVLDIWFERVVKPRLKGEAYMVRYIDDFVLCFQYRSDALRVQEALSNRLGKFGLALASAKTKLVEFGRFAQTHAGKRGRKRPETIYFLGFTLYCTCNRKGNFKVGFRTEKSRLHRSLSNLCDLMRRMRHLPVREQAINLNRVLRGHYAYYGIAGNFLALQRVHRAVERYWYKALCGRSRKGSFPWAVFHRIKERFPLLRPRLALPYEKLQAIALL